MKYELPNGKTVNIPDNEIEKNMKILDISKEEAIEMWLEDEGYLDNEEQVALDEKAKKVKINHGASAVDKADKVSKPRTVKISDEKQTLYNELWFALENLSQLNGYEVEKTKENKLFTIRIGNKTFKLDLIEQRTPKK